MSSRTTNLNLVKPSSDENVSLPVINSNYDTIDTEVASRVKTSDIQNNLTSTATNKPLSAAQGKALSDTIAYFRNISDGFSSLPPYTNANDIKQNGTWKAYEWTNTPNGHSIGILSAYYYDAGYGYQLFDDYYDGGLYRRQIVSNSWSSWHKLATDTGIGEKTTPVSSGGVSTSSGNWTNLGSITLSTGSYVVRCSIDWSTNANGDRKISLFPSGQTPGQNPTRDTAVTTRPCSTSGHETYQEITKLYSVTSQTSYTLFGYQNSGTTLSAYPHIEIMKIK